MKAQINWQEKTEELKDRADRLLTSYITSSDKEVPRGVRLLLMEAVERGFRPWIDSYPSWEAPFFMEKYSEGLEIRIDILDFARDVILSPRIKANLNGKNIEITAHMSEFPSIRDLETFARSILECCHAYACRN